MNQAPYGCKASPTCCPARPPREEGGGGCIEMEGGIGEAGVTTEAGWGVGAAGGCFAWRWGFCSAGGQENTREGLTLVGQHLIEDQESNKEEEGADRAAAEQMVGGKNQVIVRHHWEIHTWAFITILGQKVEGTLTMLSLRFSDFDESYLLYCLLSTFCVL